MEAGPGPQSLAARAKDRSPKQMRALICERSLLQRSDGSARWGQDGTSVLAAVYGPKQADMRQVSAEKAVVEVIFKPRSGVPGALEHTYEEVVRQTTAGVISRKLHPRTVVTIIIQVLQDDGSLLSCSLNAACAALVDAGVPMDTTFGSVTCAVTPAGSLLLDPDAAEEKAAAAVVCAAYNLANSSQLPSPDGGVAVEDGVLTLHCIGQLQVAALSSTLDACRRGCEGVAKFLRLTLLHTFKVALTSQPGP